MRFLETLGMTGKGRGDTRFSRRMLWLAPLVTFFWATLGHAQSPSPAPSGPVFVLPVKGEITKAQFVFLRRGLKTAERAGAAAIVLDMDTYGGRLDATVDIQKALLEMRVPTFAYINPNAGSAGALIALATQHIYMAPVSAIGAAAPVGGGGEDLNGTMRDKAISYYSNFTRSVAAKQGHNPDIAEAFINKEKEVKVGAETVSAKGSLLTLDAQAAARRIDNKPVLANGIADSIADLLNKTGHRSAEIRRLEPTGFEQIAQLITTLAPLLLLAGLVGAYVEIKTPGAIWPGVVAAICFALVFLGHSIAGLAGWETVAFFVVGMLLVLLEVFLAPGTVLPGLVGICLIVGSLVWAMVDHYPRDPILARPDAWVWPLFNFSLAAALALVAGAGLAAYLPRTGFYRRLVLGAVSGPHVGKQGIAARTDLPAEPSVALGLAGIARTALRPSGRAEFGGRTLDVVSDGGFIETGVAVRVVALEGARIVVAAVEASS